MQNLLRKVLHLKGFTIGNPRTIQYNALYLRENRKGLLIEHFRNDLHLELSKEWKYGGTLETNRFDYIFQLFLRGEYTLIENTKIKWVTTFQTVVIFIIDNNENK